MNSMRARRWSVILTAAWGIAWQAGCSIPDFAYPPGPPRIMELSATPFELSSGESYVLRWQVENATNVTLISTEGRLTPTEEAVDQAGSRTIVATEDITWTLSARGPGGDRTAVVRVQTQAGQEATIERFEARPSRVRPRDPVRVFWATENARRIVISVVDGPVLRTTTEPEGNFIFRPSTNQQLRLRTEGGALIQEQTVDIVIEDGPPIIDRFFAEPPVANPSITPRLIWRVSRATRLQIAADTIGFLREIADPDPEGTIDIETDLPLGRHRFRMVAFNEVATATATAELLWTTTTGPQVVRFDVSPPVTGPRGDVRVAWNVTGAETIQLWQQQTLLISDGQPVDQRILSVNETTTLQLIAADSLGSAEAQQTVLVDPQRPEWRQASATPRLIAPGVTSTITFEVLGATEVVLESSAGDPPLTLAASSTTVTVRPEGTTTYTLLARSPAGDSAKFVTIEVASPPRIDRFEFPSVVRVGQRFQTRWQTQAAYVGYITWNDQAVSLQPISQGNRWLSVEGRFAPGLIPIQLDVENGPQRMTMTDLVEVLPASDFFVEEEPNDTPEVANAPFSLFNQRVTAELTEGDKDLYFMSIGPSRRFEGNFFADCQPGIRLDIYRDDGQGGWQDPFLLYEGATCPLIGVGETAALADIESPFLLAVSATSSIAPVQIPYDLALTTEDRSCGDGILDYNEDCDDNNTEALDGCDPGCFIEGLTELEPNRTRFVASLIDIDLTAQGYLHPRDRDWYQFDVAPEQTGAWDLRMEGPNGPDCFVFAQLELYDDAGRLLAKSVPPTTPSFTCPRLTGPRAVLAGGMRYFLKVEGTRQPPLRGPYRLVLTPP